MAWTTPATFATNETPLTSTKLNTHLRDNMRELWHEVAYVEFTAPVTLTNATHTELAPADIVSSGAITYVANPILVEFYAPNYVPGGNGAINLWDGTTDLGRLIDNVAASPAGIYLPRRLTPTAASHTYKIVGWANGGNGSVVAGAGGVGVEMPGFIRIMQKGGT
jgi:hypothetical protein